jgi:hypothetical protein
MALQTDWVQVLGYAWLAALVGAVLVFAIVWLS